MKLVFKEDPRAWRRFSLSLIVPLAVLGLLLWWRRKIGPAALAGELGCLLAWFVGCLAKPAWFRGLYRVGMAWGWRFTLLLGQVMLVLLFFLVLTPLGWGLRLCGKDLLSLKRRPEATSYWQRSRGAIDLEKMY